MTLLNFTTNNVKYNKFLKYGIHGRYKNIYSTNSAALQFLLKCQYPICHISAKLQSADIYELNYNSILVIGWESFGKKLPYEFTDYYELKAKAASYDKNLPWDKREKFLLSLYKELVNKILKEEF